MIYQNMTFSVVSDGDLYIVNSVFIVGDSGIRLVRHDFLYGIDIFSCAIIANVILLEQDLFKLEVAVGIIGRCVNEISACKIVQTELILTCLKGLVLENLLSAELKRSLCFVYVIEVEFRCIV